MKKFVLLALGAMMMVGCIRLKTDAEIAEEKRYCGYRLVVIDSCEYLEQQIGYRGYFAHKGNCKYCQQRLRQMMWEVQDSILNTMD